MHRSLVLVALLSASVLGAQETQPTEEPVVAAYSSDDAVAIDAGMTREQVVAKLGSPAAVRVSGAFTYLFFANGCPRSCGMDDLVILENGVVTDAIFRGLGRRYTGTSSSPAGVVPGATLGARAPRPAMALRTEGTPRAFDAPAPSMVMPAPSQASAEPVEARSAAPAPAAPASAPARASTPTPASTPASAPASTPAAQPSRRAPVDAFRIVPVVPDSASGRARADSTSRP